LRIIPGACISSVDESNKIITLGLGGIEIRGGVIAKDSNTTSTVGVDALGVPFSCIVGLLDSFGITILT
jgi:hypothetical protein